jgi:hypothetical protein
MSVQDPEFLVGPTTTNHSEVGEYSLFVSPGHPLNDRLLVRFADVHDRGRSWIDVRVETTVPIPASVFD